MKRAYCAKCERPAVTCICHCINSVKNDIHVIILQHPSEVKQTKGTVTLLSQSLSKVDLFIGEDFTHNAALLTLMRHYRGKVALLYPSDKAVVMTEDNTDNTQVDFQDIRCLIVLDGTWKKAFKLYMSNPFLQSLLHCALPDDIECLYQVRKTEKVGALSTLEATCHALSFLEQDINKYTPIFDGFLAFNRLLMSFSTPSTKQSKPTI